jgi:predicted transcriptional regulator
MPTTTIRIDDDLKARIAAAAESAGKPAELAHLIAEVAARTETSSIALAA